MITATSLLADLTRRGVRLWADGEFLEYESPKGVLTPQDLAVVRANKPELMAELRRCEPTEDSRQSGAQAPFDQFMVEWRATAEQIRASFTRNGVQPSDETMQAATWIAFQLDEGWSFRHLRETDARQFLQAIVRGRCVAAFNDCGRVVIRNAPRTSARIVL